jgi:hypothetical protein
VGEAAGDERQASSTAAPGPATEGADEIVVAGGGAAAADGAATATPLTRAANRRMSLQPFKANRPLSGGRVFFPSC